MNPYILVPEERLPAHLYISGGWKKPRGFKGGAGYGIQGPLEDFSATMLDKFGGCMRAGAFSYIWGIKEKFKNQAATDGNDVHVMLDGHFAGNPLPLPPELARGEKIERELTREEWLALRALPALRMIPRLDQVDELHREVTEWLDTTYVDPSIEPLRIQVKRDLEFRIGDKWYLYDYKTCNKWERMLGWRGKKTEPDPNALKTNTQGILYPLDTMIRRWTKTVSGLWVYLIMDPEENPAAKGLPAEFEFEESKQRAVPIIRRADHIRQLIRLRVHPNDLPPNPCKCLEYLSPARDASHPKGEKPETGGCPYRREVGGPCSYDGPKSRTYGNSKSSDVTLSQLDRSIIQGAFSTMTQSIPAGAPPLPPGYHWELDTSTNQYKAVVDAVVAAPPPPQFGAVPAGLVMPQVPFAPPEASQFTIAQNPQTSMFPAVAQASAAPVPQAPPVSAATPGAAIPPPPPSPAPEEAPKQRRKRRTKEQIAADEAAAAAATNPAAAMQGQMAAALVPPPSTSNVGSAPAGIKFVRVVVGMDDGIEIAADIVDPTYHKTLSSLVLDKAASSIAGE